MDARRFDSLARALSEAGSRRGLLGLLATLPVVGGFFALLDGDDEVDAKGRRKRRKKRHKHGKGRRRKHHQKCKPHAKTKTCSGKCGPVKDNCKKTVDCGSCDCDPPCEECFACQGEPGTCVPQDTSTPCGTPTFFSDGTLFPQGHCDGDGTCLSRPEESCDPYTHCTGDGTACASTCQDDNDCVAGSFCNSAQRCVGDGDDGDPCDHGGECASGHCVDAVCCATASCPACQACNVDGDRGTCGADPGQVGAPCGGSAGQVCQSDGACECDASSCPDTAPICESGECRGCSSDTDCEAASLGDLCCNGKCFTGICCGTQDCPAATAPDCEGHVCTCGGDPACAGDPVLCCAGDCVNTDTDPDNCGTCGRDCPAGQTCQDGVCGVACGSDFCPAPEEVCCDGACEECCDNGDCSGGTPICLDNTCEPCREDPEACPNDACCNAVSGACVATCPASEHICSAANVCICDDHADCGANALCVDGACHACTVTCTMSGHTCSNSALRSAMNGGGTVYVCPGRYTGTFGGLPDVTVIGAGQGEDPSVDTVLDGTQQGPVFTISGRTVTLRQLHITGGRANGIGAGVDANGSQVTMTDCTLANNHVTDSSIAEGGGIYSIGGRLEMTRCIIRNNSATATGSGLIGEGGGIFALSTLVLTDCEIHDNRATSDGGGILTVNETRTLTNCRIHDNTLDMPASSSAGGLAAFGDAVTLRDSFVWDNTAPNCLGDITVEGVGGCDVTPPA